MKTIAVAPKNEKDFSFISELLKKLGYNPMILSEDEIEDRNLLKNDDKGEERGLRFS